MAGTWRRPANQLAAIQLGLAAPPSAVDCSAANDPIEYVEGANAVQSGEVHPMWLTGDLYQALARLGEGGMFSQVVGMIEEVAKRYPESVMTGLAFTSEGGSVVQEHFCARLVPYLIEKYPDTLRGLKRLWVRNPKLFVSSVERLAADDPEMALRVVDVCQSLNVVQHFIARASMPVALDLAVAAAQWGQVQLHVWLQQ